MVFMAYTLRRQIDRERRADDEHRRRYAKRVRVSIIKEPFKLAEVTNDGDANIYRVGVYVLDRQTREVIFSSGKLEDIIGPAVRHEFPLMPAGKREAETPTGHYCLVQFTDDDGYRWNRYMMGLLEEVMHGNELAQARAEAQRVIVSIVEEPLAVEVVNNSEHDIYQVDVLIRGKSDGSLIAVGATTEEVVSAGRSNLFSIEPARQDSNTPVDCFWIAQFTDKNGIRWNKYLRGRLDAVGPEPCGIRRTRRGEISIKFLHAIHMLRRLLAEE